MADCETGELYWDNETGERLYMHSSTHLNYETGEEERNSVQPKKTTFKIQNFQNDTTNRSRQQHRRKLSTQLCTNDISPIVLFLMPTIFLYPAITIIPVALEVLIHMWAHRKNKTMRNPNFYYKSPLHLYAREFCAKCREDIYMTKIGKLQDKRTMKYEYLKRMVT